MGWNKSIVSFGPSTFFVETCLRKHTAFWFGSGIATLGFVVWSLTVGGVSILDICTFSDKQLSSTESLTKSLPHDKTLVCCVCDVFFVNGVTVKSDRFDNGPYDIKKILFD